MPGVEPAGTVLFVCTANQCRSPMAEALLRQRLGAGSAISVTSAGFLEDGYPCPTEVLEVMDQVGLDLSGHRSRQLDAATVSESSLIVTMGRQHLIDLVVRYPDAWQRAFTVSELLDRAGAAGGRTPDETLEDWATRLSWGRQRSDLLKLRSGADVADPMGKSIREFRDTRDRLMDFADRLFMQVVHSS